MISSRVFHALGYNVSETYLVVFDRERLVVENNGTELTSLGELRTLLPEDIDRLLDPSHGAATGGTVRSRSASLRKVNR